jgi:FtsZ-binding cell division protein ZapB
MERKLLGIDVIRIDGDTQSRAEIDQAMVAEYSTNMQDGDQFPAVVAYFDGVNYWLGDGFHRYHATKKAGIGSILADVINGTNRDAQLYSLGANSLHGLRRKNADKRKAVMTMLNDFEWQEWSNAEIARHCRVSPTLVASLRGDDAPDVRKFKMADGTVAEKRVPKRAEQAASKPVAEEPVVDSNSDHDDMVAELVAENERVNDRLAVAAMEGTEEEKAMAADTIESLREEIRILKIELVAVKQSRDQYQSENGQMKKQMSMYERKLKAKS